MPIRIVTKELRYIHELSLTLEHSMSISRRAELPQASGTGQQGAREGGDGGRGGAGAGVANARYPA